MSILVAYASKYRATHGIAERIAEKLRAAGQEAEVRPVKAAGDLTGYEAVVIGSAIYYGSWLKEAMEFVRRNRTVLAARPVWLFSSGPLGTSATDAQGRDLRRAAEPKELAELRAAINPRDHRVFFGALDRGKMGLKDRMITNLAGADHRRGKPGAGDGRLCGKGPRYSWSRPRRNDVAGSDPWDYA